MPSPEQTTEQYFDPTLPKTHGQPIAVVSWTDASGAHEVTVSAPTTVGKSTAAQIVLSDPSVSGIHLELTPSADGVMVRDLQSTNGTYLDKMRVYLIQIPGDFRLRLGRVEIQIRQPGSNIEQPLWPKPWFGKLFGQSVVMRRLFEQLANVAKSDETVLLQGETGSGKELVAAAIHEHSPRGRKPYVVVDCGTLNPNLAESELFGHVKGAFSGATRDHEGAFEVADGGTLFLDEIGELPLAMQTRLLRALESREIRRVGETEYRSVNVRVIAASFRDLREMVNQRAFREDLYHRLAVVPLRVPPLRERADDIPLLVKHFVEKRPAATMPGDAVMKRLREHSWTGNVRELLNVVRRASVLGWDAAIADGIGGRMDGGAGAEAASAEAASAPAAEAPATAATAVAVAVAEDELSPVGGTYQEAKQRWIEKGERAYIPWLLAKYNGIVSRAAIGAAIDQTTLRRIMRKLKG